MLQHSANKWKLCCKKNLLIKLDCIILYSITIYKIYLEKKKTLAVISSSPVLLSTLSSFHIKPSRGLLWIFSSMISPFFFPFLEFIVYYLTFFVFSLLISPICVMALVPFMAFVIAPFSVGVLV